ncbi:hamartin-like [Polypterus senegalus]|uniref:hamartin-like n=1 Tax=Polypterus senegalus TaxID=55291 RepID=UPI001962DD6F|nr:hamartin-like [Polypterus senegalus]
MAKEQPNVGDLLHLLETSDLHELEEVRAAINEHLNTDRGSIFLNSLVDYYLETSSRQALHILSSVREPHDKHLLDKLNDCMTKSACRLATLTLLEHVIRKQPPWIHKVSRAPILQALLKCLKTDTNIVVLITGVLVLIILLPMIPQPGKQNLYEFFDIFGRLASWNLKTPGNTPEIYLIHLHVSVYALFHRLYGMYPCNFVSYLRSHYSMKENMETFEEVVKPMLEHVRIHPELVTGTKDHELDPTRWKRFEIHDIVIECAKVSLDPKEASCEEGYSSIPEHFTTHLQHRQTDITDPHSCYTSASSTPFTTPRQTMAQPSCRSPQTLRCSNDPNRDVFWSPSTVCGMSTPPSSRGISPTNVASELSHSAPNLPCRLHNTPVGSKCTISNTPATSSPPHFCSDEYVNISVQPQAITPTHKDMRPGHSHDYDGASSEVIGGSGDAIESKTTMTLDDLPQFIKELEQQDQKEREDDAIREELYNITEGKSESPGPRGGFDSPFYRTTETLTDGERKHAIPAHPALIAASSCGPSSDNALCTPDKLVPAATTRTDNQGAFPFKPVFTPIDRPVLQISEGHFGVASEERQKPLFTPSPCKAQTAPYEALFELALPKAAALFVARKTAEAAQRVGAKYPIEDDGKGHVSTSPLEVLDCLIQQGKDAHVRELNRLPLPSKSADWTHYGGSPPSDEIQTLRSQLLLLHNQLLYERYKREQHAVRNRRLLRRIINATALEEQNNAMKDQLKLQEDDIQSLKASLSEEQARNKKLREEHETMVSQLHTQIRQLQQGCDKYSTANQELQSKLMEYKKAAGDLRVELQKANNKICNTGHLLNQLRQKLTNSETVQQQMEFLNKQLLLLGEVNELYMEELRQSSPDNSKEEEMLKIAYEKENEKLRFNAIQQSQRLEASQRRIVELETQFTKKEHLLMEQKKYLEDFKSQAR